MSDPKEERDSLVREVRETLQHEQLKREILKELQPQTWASAMSRVGQHPAFLVLITFALTGLLGTFLASRWQGAEWDRQQRQNIWYHRIERQYGIINDLIAAVGARNAALRDIANRLEYRSREQTPETPETLKNDFDRSRKEWNVASAVLQHKIGIYFCDPMIHKACATFMQQQNHRTYPELLAAIFSEKSEATAAAKWVQDTLDSADEDQKRLAPLIMQMWNETASLYNNERQSDECQHQRL